LRVESGPDLRGDGWQATELRYQGPDRTEPLAMTLIMPDDLTPFESKMSGEQLTQIASDLTKERKRLNEAVVYAGGGEMDCGTYPYSLDLFMPRFKIGTRAELGNALKTLGMPIAFDASRADFSGIHAPGSGGDVIHIENVIHQANIDVDEEGTEAAAATAIGADTGGCTGPSPGKSITLRLDHPFLFALRDIETGAVLFMGRVVDPSITQ
jgi:serpin B